MDHLFQNLLLLLLSQLPPPWELCALGAMESIQKRSYRALFVHVDRCSGVHVSVPILVDHSPTQHIYTAHLL